MLNDQVEVAPRRSLIVLALMMAVSLAALDMSVVGTAMPTIVGALGGLKLFSWVFSVFLLTSTVTVPLYGKLADLYGRKPVLMFGAVLFVTSSALCGASQSMSELILFRALQGIGAGAVLPITITIIGDLFSIAERAKIQGVISGVWGVTGVAGPALGGLITDTVGWRWVFYINLPFGVAAIALLALYYVERPEKRSHVLDYWGFVLLSGAVVSLLMALLQGAEAYGWMGAPTLAMFALAALLLALFVRQEGRCAEPVVPLSLFGNRIIAVSSLAVFVAGGVMFGVQSYVPLFEQGVFGGSATAAGLVLAPMSVSWVTAAIVSGKLILRLGYYPIVIAGGACLLTGAVVLLALSASTSILVAALAGLVIGVGMGFVTNATVIAVQNAVEWRQRGIATASTQFFRTIGGSISVAIMGALLNSRVAARLDAIDGAPKGGDAQALLNRADRSALEPAVLQAMQHALSASLHEIFFIVLACSALCLASLLFFPRGHAAELAASSTPVEPAMPGDAVAMTE